MSDLLSIEAMIDGILALMVVEALLVLGWRALRGEGPAPLPFVATLCAGGLLLLAFRNARAGGSPGVVALCLFCAFLAHVADLAARWTRARENSAPPVAPVLRATVSLRASTTRVVSASQAPANESPHGG